MNNVARPAIVIATPHARNDGLEAGLGGLDFEIVRIRRREELTAARLGEIRPRYVFFPHWSWKIPAEIFDRFECVIFHMTDVPYGRGGSPLQNLIVRGHESTMLSALRCVEDMDAGPVYLKKPLSLHGTAEEILMRAGDLIGEMIVEIATMQPEPRAQVGEVVAFARRTPADGALDGATTLSGVYDLIRMLDAEGYPPAFLDTGPFRLEFSRAKLGPDSVVAEVRIQLREES